jgi:hypothetical protein
MIAPLLGGGADKSMQVGPVGLEPTTYGLKGHCLGRWWSLMVV